MSITQKIVLLHGGTIEAESRPREGTTFTVRIPDER
ncbi:ATP-binding protein [Paenibacillus catalpae]